MDADSIADNFRVVDISKEISDIVPGWLFGIHRLGQNGQFFDVCLCHIHTNLSFHKQHYHQCRKIKKLKEKKQTDLQQKQAAEAIYIYYGEETIPEDKNVLSKANNKIISSKKNKLKPTNASWVPEYNDLNAEIKIREKVKKHNFLAFSVRYDMNN